MHDVTFRFRYTKNFPTEHRKCNTFFNILYREIAFNDKIQCCLPTGYQMKRHSLTCPNSNIPAINIMYCLKPFYHLSNIS